MTQVATDKSSVARTSKDWDLRAIAPFIALALLLVLGTIANPNFISIDNLLNVATRSAFIAIIALGATYVISSGGLDLSVGAMVAFVASIMILFMNSGVIADPVMMLIAAVMLALIVGAACGLLNGLITTVGGIEPFIATLGTMGIYRGLTTW
ncbi:MAG: ABC transporter permease, partial [Brucella anthropi]